MKKLFIAVLILIAGLISCKKDNISQVEQSLNQRPKVDNGYEEMMGLSQLNKIYKGNLSYCWNCWSTSNNSIADAIMVKLNNGELKYLSPLDLSQSPYWPSGINGILPSTTLKWTNQ